MICKAITYGFCNYTSRNKCEGIIQFFIQFRKTQEFNSKVRLRISTLISVFSSRNFQNFVNQLNLTHLQLYDKILSMVGKCWWEICLKGCDRNSSSQQYTFLPSRLFVSAIQRHWWKVFFVLDMCALVHKYVCLCLFIFVCTTKSRGEKYQCWINTTKTVRGSC